MILEALFAALVLTLFNLDSMLIEVFQPLFKVELTQSHYYVLFILLGLIGYLFKGNEKDSEQVE